MELEHQNVAKHNRREDAWIIIQDKVYDVTTYLHDHPGGAEVLAEVAGADATEAFGDAGHSDDAKTIMEFYLIGHLKKKKNRAENKTAVDMLPLGRGLRSTKRRTPRFAVMTMVMATAMAALYHVGNHAGRRGASTALAWTLSLLRDGGRAGQHRLVKGILIGVVVTAAAGIFLVQKLARSFWGKKSFPPYIKATTRPVRQDPLLQRGLLDPSTFTSLTLLSKTKLTHNVCKFTFALPTTDTVAGLPPGQHVTIKADIGPQSERSSTVSRSYMPISNNSDRGIIELAVKIYPHGKLTSGYMSSLEVGDEVQFRGPLGAMRYHHGLCERIGMVAGGTGITPMFQIIRAICQHDRDLTRVSLIYANRTEHDIILRDQLDALARSHPRNLTVHYLLDQPPPGWAFDAGPLTRDLMRDRLPGPGDADTKVLICGPPGLVDSAKTLLVNDLGFQPPLGPEPTMADQVFVF